MVQQNALLAFMRSWGPTWPCVYGSQQGYRDWSESFPACPWPLMRQSQALGGWDGKGVELVIMRSLFLEIRWVWAWEKPTYMLGHPLPLKP